MILSTLLRGWPLGQIVPVWKKRFAQFYRQNCSLYPMDANEVYTLFRNCKTTKFSGLHGLSNNVLKIAGPMLSEFLAVIFIGCIQGRCFQNEAIFSKEVTVITPKTTVQFHWYHSWVNFAKFLVKRLENLWERCDVQNSKQYGFRKGWLTLLALIDLTETIRQKSAKMKKQSAHFWTRGLHSLQSITEFR